MGESATYLWVEWVGAVLVRYLLVRKAGRVLFNRSLFSVGRVGGYINSKLLISGERWGTVLVSYWLVARVEGTFLAQFLLIG